MEDAAAEMLSYGVTAECMPAAPDDILHRCADTETEALSLSDCLGISTAV